MNPVAELPALRQQYQQARSAAIDRFRTTQDPDALARALGRATDRALRGLWRIARPGRQTALLAVGGYGRGDQFPQSDVDLLILHADQPDAEQLRRLEVFVGACWDFGLPIGHSVRTPAQCLEEARADITVQTAMLEMRWLAGARSQATELAERLRAELDVRGFFSAKLLEMRQRHAKYEDTPYSLEPNTKESPGGLRDLHVILWIARAAGFGSSWPDLQRRDLITASEAGQLRRNDRQIRRIRAWLHILSGRREDRIVFDLQASVAAALGLARADARASSEELMQRYYWAAKAVTQLNTIVLQNLRAELFPVPDARPEPIDAEFRNLQGMLDVVDPGLFEREPAAMLRAFLTMERHSELSGMTTRTLRALWHARARIDGVFRRDAGNRELFLRILQAPRGVTHELRRMNQWSILGRYLPVFRRIVGRMQHDLFHVYTVDQHILMVVRNVRRFFIPEHAHEYPFCSQLAAQWDEPWLLYIAALFHDVAKGRGGDHSELGVREVRRFCREHGIEREDTALLEFLVGHHLTMSRIAQKEDLADPDVIESFARRVGSERRLTALYLLTVADIRGTSPKVWNAWKGKLLEDLYRLTLRALGGARPNLDAEIELRKQEAQHLLALHSMLPGTERPLWDTLEVSYFARHDAADIAWHARSLWRHVKTKQPVVRARLSPLGEGLQVLVYSPDRADLFARICGYFDGAGFNILDAKIHTTRTGYALDTFQVVSPTLEEHYRDLNYRDLIALVENQAALALAAGGPLPEPSRGRLSRRVKSFPVTPRVTLRPDERAQRWLLSVSASDRTGLLYAIARVLARHRINLQLAKITTLGERVEDTFLVDGPELQHNRRQLAIESELLDVLAPMAT